METNPFPTDYQLTLEQQFEMQRMRNATKGLSRSQATELLLQATQLLIVKSNIVKDLKSKLQLED
jgi:hypothetical protein